MGDENCGGGGGSGGWGRAAGEGGQIRMQFVFLNKVFFSKVNFFYTASVIIYNVFLPSSIVKCSYYFYDYF